MNWSDIRLLHLEITSRCNSYCPSCSRYVGHSYELNKVIDNNQNWTLEQTKKRLPAEDLKNISTYHFNGTVGDFCANSYALEICQYLVENSDNPFVNINTNGSLRNKKWWGELAKIKNIQVAFALDGMEDTHKLYRRETSWQKIIENSQEYIKQGGSAEWIMTIFKHNQHQVEQCKKLSQELGFSKFTTRFNDRRGGVLLDKNGNINGVLEQADNSPLKDILGFIDEKQVKFFDRIEVKETKSLNLNPFTSLNDCPSFVRKEVYINSKWQVAPCCHIGNVFFFRNRFIYDIESSMQHVGLNLNLIEADDNRTVADIVNSGFNYATDHMLSNNILEICDHACGKNTAFTIGRKTRDISLNNPNLDSLTP